MPITLENFGEEFINKFSKKHQDYIINFCNTFQKTFPGVLEKEVIIQRILTISNIEQVPQLGNEESGRTVYSSLGENAITYIENLSEKDEKNIVYHELMHVLSRHSQEFLHDSAGLTLEGIKEYESNPDDFYFENRMFDEIMNEFYTVKLLETEGELDEKSYILNLPNYKLNSTRDIFRHFGNGYIDCVQLAEILNNIFGNDLFRAKFLDGKSFRKMFNEKYKDLDISMPQCDNLPPAKEITPFERFQFQIGLSEIYESFQTAIDMWKIKEKENARKNGINLYEYLKKTKELISFLPVREDDGAYRNDKTNIGIPKGVFDRIQQMDFEYICEYINPDIMKIQDEDSRKREINIISTIINILRENIDELSEHDIENVTYGKIKEYTHSGRDCLIINVNGIDFMTFVNNSTDPNFQFTAYCKFKKISEYKDYGYTEETESRVIQRLAKCGYNGKDFTYATIMDNGQYGMWSLVKSDGLYYRTSGEISEVQLSDIKPIGISMHRTKESIIDSKLSELASGTTITRFNKASRNIACDVNKGYNQLKLDENSIEN